MTQVEALRPSLAELEALGWRALWTGIQAATATAGAAGFGWIEADAWGSLGVGAAGAMLSVIKSFAGQKLKGTSQ